MNYNLISALAVLLGLFSCKQPDNSTNVNDHLGAVTPTIETTNRVTNAHIRGLFLINDSVGWASGTEGTFLKMVNGKTWVSDTVSSYTHLDFRDVHAFDEHTAILMAAGNEGRILRTSDGGKSWQDVYTNLEEGIFLDGMDFQGDVGYCYGDPIKGKFVVLKSDNRGKTWRQIEPSVLPDALSKEAGFAASGTGVLTFEKTIIIATGGDSIARVLKTTLGESSWKFFNTPIRSGEGCGIFSMTNTNQTVVAVGGCYLDSTNNLANCAISKDGGKSWKLINESAPRGYRSCVAYAEAGAFLIACGRTGIDISYDYGQSWKPLSNEGYYVCALSESTGWLMGKRGKMAQITW